MQVYSGEVNLQQEEAEHYYTTVSEWMQHCLKMDLKVEEEEGG